MKHTRLLFVLLGFAALGYAADPFVGTWKLNPAKTKFTTGAAPKDQTVTIAATGSDLDITIAGTAADGSAIASHYTVPAAGGTGKIISSPYDGVSSKRASQTERSVSYSKGGKAVYTTHSKLSADGKTLTVTAKGTNATGQAVEGTVVYDKQ
jgi:hypothetical protein